MRANQGKVVSRPLAVFAVLAAVALVLWATLRQPNAAFTSEKAFGQIFSSSDVRTGRSDVYYTALTSAEVEALAPPGRVRINPPGRGIVSWDVVRAKLAERAQSITRQVWLLQARTAHVASLSISHVALCVCTRQACVCMGR